MRTNTYDPATGRLTVSPTRAAAIENLSAYYADVFSSGRNEYAIPAGALTAAAKAREVGTFFFWTSWVASTNRPGERVSYTQNWPHEPLVGNVVTGNSVVWSVISFVLLLAGIGGMVWYFASQEKEAAHDEVPSNDPLLGLDITPSQRATLKYFFVVAALIVVQIALGVVAAHYGVEGNGLYGIPLAKWLPYSVVRPWHPQIGIFWIATSWLATGLFIAPAVSGYEPRRQRLGVNLLFAALLFVVVGCLPRAAARHLLFLVRRPGLRVRCPRSLLADTTLRRPRLLALPGVEGARARAQAQGRKPLAAHALHRRLSCHPALLRGGAAVRAAQPHRHGGVLALVGRTPLGQRLLRGLRDGRHRVPVHAPQTFARADGDEGRALLDGHLPFGRHHRHVPPPLLHGHAEQRARARRGLLGAGDRAACAHRLRGLGEHQAGARPCVDGRLQVAALLLRRRRLLELRGRGPLRLPHQPAGGALLHAGHEHDAAARPHGSVRRLRLARHRPDALLPAGAARRARVEGVASALVFLDDERRPRPDGLALAAPDGADADVGLGRVRHLVRALGGVPPDRRDERPALDARRRRLDLRPRRTPTRLLRPRPHHRPLLHEGRAGQRRRACAHAAARRDSRHGG